MFRVSSTVLPGYSLSGTWRPVGRTLEISTRKVPGEGPTDRGMAYEPSAIAPWAAAPDSSGTNTIVPDGRGLPSSRTFPETPTCVKPSALPQPPPQEAAAIPSRPDVHQRFRIDRSSGPA